MTTVATVALCYHRIRAGDGNGDGDGDGDGDAKGHRDPQLLEVRPETFERHLRMLRSLGDVVNADDVVHARGDVSGGVRGAPLRFCVTFDDGYADNAVAADIAAAADVPLSIFVTSGFTEGTASPYWDELTAVLDDHDVPALDVRVAGRVFSWPRITGAAVSSSWHMLKAANEPRAALYASLTRFFRMLTPAQRVDARTQLIAAGVTLSPSPAFLSATELAALHDRGVTIAAHTRSHALLTDASLSDDEVTQEIAQSLDDVSRWTGARVRTFAYPYGAVDERVQACAAAAGVRVAMTTERAPIRRRGRGADPLRAPRLLVRDWSPGMFLAQLMRTVAGQ